MLRGKLSHDFFYIIQDMTLRIRNDPVFYTKLDNN